jgi:hypothetical protein
MRLLDAFENNAYHLYARKRWIGFSKTMPIADGADKSQARTHAPTESCRKARIYQRIEDNAFHLWAKWRGSPAWLSSRATDWVAWCESYIEREKEN